MVTKYIAALNASNAIERSGGGENMGNTSSVLDITRLEIALVRLKADNDSLSKSISELISQTSQVKQSLFKSMYPYKKSSSTEPKVSDD